MIKIGFLASGNGGTLKFLHLVQKKNLYNISIQFVISDRDCGAIEYAINNKIPNHIVKYNKTNRQDLLDILSQQNDVDIIITNIHKVLDEKILKKFDRRLINLHYSILPAYSGLIGMKTVDIARKDNTRFLGATCHEVSEILDGGKIICQSSFSVNWQLPDEEIKDLVFQSANLCLLNSILLKTENKNKLANECSYQQVKFNPTLQFNTEEFNDDFWAILKN